MKLKEIIELDTIDLEDLPKWLARKKKPDPKAAAAKKWMADVTAEFEKINRKGGRIDWALAQHLMNQGKNPKEIAKKVKR